MHQWISLSVVNAGANLFAKYLSPVELEDVRRRMIAHVDDWPQLFAEVRAQMEAGAGWPIRPSGPARRWQELFRDSYCGDDAALEGRIHGAAERTRTVGRHRPDLPLILFIQRAILSLRERAQTSVNTGPRPSAQRVATLRAAHRLLDTPLILDDPLALRILGSSNEAAVRGNPHYDDPLSRGSGCPSRCAAAMPKIRGRRLRSMAYANTSSWRRAGHLCLSRAPPVGRIFEVDLPATQQWKQECLSAAGIGIPASLTYVPTDFEHGSRQAPCRMPASRWTSPLSSRGSASRSTRRKRRSWRPCASSLRARPAAPSSSTMWQILPCSRPWSAWGRSWCARRSRKAESRGRPFRSGSAGRKPARAGIRQSGQRQPGGPERSLPAGRTDGFRMGSAMRLMHAVV